MLFCTDLYKYMYRLFHLAYNLTGQYSNPPFTDSYLRFEFSLNVRVSFLVKYPIVIFTETCVHVFIGSATYIVRLYAPITTHCLLSI